MKELCVSKFANQKVCKLEIFDISQAKMFKNLRMQH